MFHDAPIALLTITNNSDILPESVLPAVLTDREVMLKTVTPATASDTLRRLWDDPIAAIVVDGAIAQSGLFTTLHQLSQAATKARPMVIVMGDNDAALAVQAIKAGAADYWVRDRLTIEQVNATLADVVGPTLQTTASPSERRVDSPLLVSPPASDWQPLAATLPAAQQFIQWFTVAAPGMLYIFDLTEQRNVYVNRQLGAILGYQSEQIAALGGNLLATLMHPDDLPRAAAHLDRFQQAQDGDVLELEYRMRHADGTWCWLRTREVVFQRQTDGTPQLVLGISQNISGHKQVETSAREHRNRFQLVTETIQDVFWIADFHTPKILYVSPAYEEIWGRSPDDVLQNYTLWVETIHPDDRDRVIKTAAQAITQDVVEQDYRIVRPDGTIRWIRDRGFMVRGPDGEVEQTVGVAQDITERKLAEKALAENEARLSAFVESNVVGILYGDIYGGISAANDELLRLVGYTREDLTAGRLNWLDMTPPKYLPLDERKCAEAQLHGACTPFEKEYIRKDGTRVPILIGFSLFGERREQSVCFVLDLTKRKKTERAHRRSEDRLRMALESAQLGTWDWNLVTNKLVWDDRCKAMFGLSPASPVTIDIFFTALHPDDHERIKQQINHCLSSASDGVYDVEYRITGIEDQIERWVLAKGQVYVTPEGTPKRFIGTVLDITDRKRAETALRESEERLQLAIEGSGGGFWDWNIVTNEDYLSAEWVEMLGFEPDEIPAKYSSWEQLIHPDDKTRVMEMLDAHLRDARHSYQFEYRLRMKSGEWKWIANFGKVVKRDETGQPIRMAGIHLDISDRKQAEEQVQLSEARYRTLANAVSQLMWISRSDGQVEFFNRQWYAYTGLQTVDFASHSWPEVIHPDDAAMIVEARTTAIVRQAAYEVEARIKRYDQVYRWHLARVVPLLDDAGQVVNWFGTATDIHDRKLAEAEREQLLAQEQTARAAAEQANRMKDEFLAILSHELRSPLNPILGWSQLLQTQEFDRAKTLQALSTIERNAKLQTQLIDDLLDVAKILRGKLQLDYQAVDLTLMITAAIETVQTSARAKSIDIEPRLPSGATVWGDEGRLQQVVWNLLSNAIKFTPEAGHITLSLTYTETTARIAVTDTGKGIQSEFLPHIFESFRQEDASITRNHGGLGLGLAIARHLTEAHGGTIEAKSPGLGQGTTFTVTLPLMATTTSAIRDRARLADVPNLAGMRILAVDDDADCRDLITSMLSAYGAEVLAADSARQALEHLIAFKPDLLISDLGMPQLDGHSLIRQIRTLSVKSGGNIPAIALSAYTREEDLKKSLHSGFQRHIAKPLEVEVLISAITELLHSSP
jgi:PAS domain S-box-containing protein